MILDLTFNEIEKVLSALRESAHESNKTANTAEYSLSVKTELHERAGDLYTLADQIENQKNRFKRKPRGSTGSIDPFDHPNNDESTKPPSGTSKFNLAKTPNDPIEW